MRDIMDTQLNIHRILSVTKKQISPPGHVNCKRCHSDCMVFILTGEADYTFGNKVMKAEPGIYFSFPVTANMK